MKYAIRSLRRTPGYTLVAVAALAIGIGANTAIFGAVDTVLLRAVPYPHPDRLVVPVSENLSRDIEHASVTYADYEDWKRETGVFEYVALWMQFDTDLTGSGDPERVRVGTVSQEYFPLVDAELAAGRPLAAADFAAGAPRAAVISHDLFMRRFGGRASAIGSTVTLFGLPYEIVGALSRRAIWPEDVELYIPIDPADFRPEDLQRRDNMIFVALARLREGATVEQGDARLATIAQRLEREHPESRKGWTNRLVPLRDYVVATDIRMALIVLLGAVGAVLLIACANLASLALVRAVGRSREIGIRFALGASRGRIVREMALEGLLLAAIGTAAGAALSVWLMKGIAAMAPEGTPFIDQLGLDMRVAAAAALFGALAVMIAGVVPALASSGIQLTPALKDGTPGSGSSRRTNLLRQSLVVAEVALAVMLAAGAALLLKSLANVSATAPGVDTARVLTARLSLPSARYRTPEARSQFYAQLGERLTAHPEIEAAGATSYVPVGGGGFGLGRVFLADGWPAPPAGPDVQAQWNVVTPGYFRAMGISMTRGRVFDQRDTSTSTPVMIVSTAFARQMFGTGNPIGRRAKSWRDENVLREIVGVAAEVRYRGLIDEERALVYVPHTQNSWGSLALTVRARHGAPETLAATLRSEVGALDPQLAVADVRTLESVARESVARERYTTLLVSILAAAAVALGGLGIYGVLSYAVSLRRQELGLRIALGASSGDLYRLIGKQAAALVGAGLAIGGLGALALSKMIGSLLYEVKPTDPVAFAAAGAAIVAAATLACVLPARRAAASDPLSALRAS
jgi:putative ABC transport system permease protein